VTHRGDEQVPDGLAAVPLGHAGRQGDLEHGVALVDLLQAGEDAPHLLGLQDPVVQQRLLVLLPTEGSARGSGVGMNMWRLSLCTMELTT